MRLFILLAVLLTPLLVRSEEPIFVARTTAGKEHTGPLARLDTDWTLEVGKGARRKVASGELIELRQKGIALPPLPTGEHLLFTNGDRVPFTSLRLQDEKIYFKHPDFGAEEISVPMSSVLLIWRTKPDRTASPEKMRRTLTTDKRKNDTVLLRNGDRIEGTLTSINQEVAIEVNRKLVKVKWPQVAAVGMSTELADKPKPIDLAARLVLTATDQSPGGRLTLLSANLLKEELRGKTTFGAIVRVPLDRIALLELLGGKAVALSALKPAKYEYRPYLDEQFSYAVDSTVTGRDLRLGGSVHERGIGTHAECSLTYDLGGKYQRFEALVGLDDIEGKRGRVRLRILVDGKEVDVGHKGVLSQATGPWRISIPIEKAKTLTLEVLPADNGPVQAVVNWVDTRLVK